MGRRLLPIVSLLVVTGLTVYVLRQRYEATAHREPPRPIAVLAHTEWDLRDASPDSAWRSAFPVKNAGNRRLIILHRPRGCDCNDSVRRKIVVPPGESVSLEALVETADLGSDTHVELDYATNDPALPKFTLTVLGPIASK